MGSATETTPLAGYVRCSSFAQATSGIGIAAQRKALEDAASNLRIGTVFADEGFSGARMTNRPGLQAALAEVDAGRASGLVVAKIDRLGRNAAEVLALAKRAEKEGWRLIALDVGLDSASPSGALVVGMLALAADFENRRISERQHGKFAELRRQGRVRGRPAADRAVADRIISLRTDGTTWQAIADTLNQDRVPTTRSGAEWRPSSVRSAYVARTRGSMRNESQRTWQQATRTTATALAGALNEKGTTAGELCC